MSDVYWARGSWEDLGVPSPSLGFSTTLHYDGLKCVERRRGQGRGGSPNYYWWVFGYLHDLTCPSQ